MLKWAGLEWEEGPGSTFEINMQGEGKRAMGPYGPYY